MEFHETHTECILSWFSYGCEVYLGVVSNSGVTALKLAKFQRFVSVLGHN